MIENVTDEKIIEIGLNSIERNFNGLKKMKEIFAEFYPKNVQIEENKVVESIKNNINDKDSRYLLLINESSYNSFLLESILNKFEMKYTFLIESQFEGDIVNKDYSKKMLNKIQFLMKEGKILILNNLEFIYSFLYNLFDLKFCSDAGKNFSRIALNNKVLANIHDDFKCIILDEKIENYKFFSFFEKHSFKCLLNEHFQKNYFDFLSRIILNIKDSSFQKKNIQNFCQKFIKFIKKIMFLI